MLGRMTLPKSISSAPRVGFVVPILPVCGKESLNFESHILANHVCS